MLKELIQFTKTALADETFRDIGLIPKNGLHLVLKIEQIDGEVQIASSPNTAYFSSKNKESTTALLDKCAAWSQAAWMVDTNKCLDLPTKAIHSASPYCFAVKRENLEGGGKYNTNEEGGKSQVYERIDSYFEKAIELIDLEEDIKIAEAFRTALSDKTQLQQWLNDSDKFKDLKDGEYVVFYLDLPIEKYNIANQKYLKEKLFNTSNYTIPDSNTDALLYGTSNWFNGFPTKKPFLLHQSATFDISGRISSEEAKFLYGFSELSRRKLFPNPLPIFVMEEELSKKAIKIYKEDQASGDDIRRGYLEIIQQLWEERKGDIGNYYLLFTVAGEIKDFDFVSKFEFNLSSDGSPWKVVDLFNIGGGLSIQTVVDFQNQIMPPLFNNALVVRRKDNNWRFRYFDDIDPQYCKTHNAALLALQYRKAFYDFIYKSKRQGITANAIENILMKGIFDDIRLDDYKNKQHTEYYNICTKLNLLFSLHQYFSKPINPRFMPNNINQLRDCIEGVAKRERQIETDDQFAFATGQVIARIFWESKTEDRSYGYLEPFLNQTNETRLKKAIYNFFKRYKHVAYSKRFGEVFSQIMAYNMDGKLDNVLPLLLAGVFSNNQLFSDKAVGETDNEKVN